MNQNRWLKHTISIAIIFAFRMLGLFMLIPVFTLYAAQLTHATPKLMGIALGCYGFTQGLLQIPFGLWSDRYGRKPLLIVGLSLFAAGSILGALTHSIEGMICARMIQGGGAIGSVLIALLADLTPDEHRTKAMAMIGSTIGVSFALAMVLSPMITASFGLAGVFNLTAILAALGLIIVICLLPSPAQIAFQDTSNVNLSRFKHVLCNRHLLRTNAGIFFQHLILTSTFFAIPLLLQPHLQSHHLSSAGIFYLPLMLLGFLFMIPCIILAERKQQVKIVFIGCVLITGISQLLLAKEHTSFWMLGFSLLLYFIAFNTLEASLPSMASRQADIKHRGSAMGLYSTCQFLGIFVGGVLSGILFEHWEYAGIFWVNVLMTLIWLGLAGFMQPLQYRFTRTFTMPNTSMPLPELKQRLLVLAGVQEVIIDADTQQIHLSLEKSQYQEGSVEQLLNNLS